LNVTLTGGRCAGRRVLAHRPGGDGDVERSVSDKAFIGACGVDVLSGATLIEPDEGAVFRAMVRQAKQVIIVADSSKIAMVSPVLICPVTDIDILVTDSESRQKLSPDSKPTACR